MKTVHWTRIIGAILVLLGLAHPAGSRAQLIPPDPFYELDSWSFQAPDWLSAAGDAPLGFTNLNNPASFDGNAVQVDAPGNAPAFLNYAIADSLVTNLTFTECTIEMWVLPDWNSGVGPGGWGRLIDVGRYATNNPSSWFSLYFSPDGGSLNFSSETNGVFTNYLSVPIAWDTNTWHLVDLTYNHFRSQLYVDGQLATNGAGVFYEPSASAKTNGFFLGSAAGGDPDTQARAQFDDLATYSYALSAAEVTNDYAAGSPSMSGGFHPTDTTPLFPSGGSGTNSGGYGYNVLTNAPPPNYSTNLWLAMLGISNNTAGLLLTNTAADILYEVQGRTNLVFGDWFSEGFVYGSELTNCAPAGVLASQQGNLFLRIRSWADDTGTGIPDWWWLQYFRQITNVNAYAEDSAGDGYTDLQKFQMGLNPNLYYNPNSPGGFFGAVDASGTNAYLYWNPAPGPVTGYLIQRGIQNTNGDYAYAQLGLISSNATFFEDAGSISNLNAQNNIYNLQAVYPGGTLTATDSWNVSWYVNTYQGSYTDGPPDGPPMPNNVYLYEDATGTNVLISWTPVPGGVTNYLVDRVGFDDDSDAQIFYPIASVGTNANYFKDAGALPMDEASNYIYAVETVFPGNIESLPAFAYDFTTNPPAPDNFTAAVDGTGTNVLLSWTPQPGIVATNFIITTRVMTCATPVMFNNHCFIGKLSLYL